VLNAVGFLDLQVDIEYEYDGNEITAVWKGEVGSGETRTITVKYKVINPLGGLYFNVPSKDYPGKTLHAITDNESERARYWLPCIDYPVVRTPLDFIIHYDSNFTCYTNGILVKSEVSASRKGMTSSHFQNEFLTPSYLICIAVGDFITVDDESVGSIPIKYIAPKRFDLKDLKRSFGETPQMMKWLQEKLDYPFPWKKYDQIVSIHIGGIFIQITKGAMENISLVTWADLYLMDEILHSERGWAVGTFLFIDDKECTNIHEMAHTYFGDLIVMRHFDHVWLKESWVSLFT
jgi:aminopeptidase N